jgi:hypothetical protein
MIDRDLFFGNPKIAGEQLSPDPRDSKDILQVKDNDLKTRTSLSRWMRRWLRGEVRP